MLGFEAGENSRVPTWCSSAVREPHQPKLLPRDFQSVAQELDGVGLDDEPHSLSRLQAKILQGATGDVNAELVPCHLHAPSPAAHRTRSSTIPARSSIDADLAAEYIARADARWAGRRRPECLRRARPGTPLHPRPCSPAVIPATDPFPQCGRSWCQGRDESLPPRHRRDFHIRRARPARGLMGASENLRCGSPSATTRPVFHHQHAPRE